MNSSERVYTAISGGKPDRVPVIPKIWVDLAARITEQDIIEVISDPLCALEVIARAGVATGVDAVRQFHFPARKIIEKQGDFFEIDNEGAIVGMIDRQGGLQTLLRDPRAFYKKRPCYLAAYYQNYHADSPLIHSIDDVRDMPVPGKDFFVHEGWGERQKTVFESYGDKIALIGDLGTATMAYYVHLRGMERALFDLTDNAPMVHAAMEKGVQGAVLRGKFLIDSGHRILRLNDSVGNMSVISPAHWREFIFPHLRDVCTEIHSHDRDAKVYCHICGNVLPVLTELVETGLDCIGPLDPLGGFTCRQAREKTGPEFALMGGVNTLTYVNGSVNDIIAESKRCIEEAGKDGAFILGSGCALPRTSKTANIAAQVEAAKRFGAYREPENCGAVR